MIGLLSGALVYGLGIITGVYLREHNIVTPEHIKSAARSIMASGKNLSAKTETNNSTCLKTSQLK